MLRRFTQDKAGTTAVFFSLSLPVLVGFVGLGTDVGYWYWRHMQLQKAADIASHAGAQKLRDTKSHNLAVAAAEYDATLHGFDDANGTLTVNTPPTSGPNQNNRSVEVIIEETEPRFFSSLFVDGPMLVRVRGVATYNENATACAIALNKTAQGAVTVAGNADVTFAGCTVTSNSLHEESVYMGNSSHLETPCLNAVGGITVNGDLDLTSCTEAREYAPYVPDPFGALPEPDDSGACKTVPNGSPVTLTPGRYCNGFNLSGDVTLEPGVYVIDDGTFKINSNSHVQGEGVTFFLTDDADTSFNGTAKIEFTAPTTGTYKGVLFFGDRSNSGKIHKFNGTADSKLVGALYFPKESVEVLGDFNGSNGCTQLVAQTITFSGSTNYSADCTGTGLDDINLAGMVRVVE